MGHVQGIGKGDDQNQGWQNVGHGVDRLAHQPERAHRPHHPGNARHHGDRHQPGIAKIQKTQKYCDQGAGGVEHDLVLADRLQDLVAQNRLPGGGDLQAGLQVIFPQHDLGRRLDRARGHHRVNGRVDGDEDQSGAVVAGQHVGTEKRVGANPVQQGGQGGIWR